MSETFRPMADWAATAIEAVGVFIIAAFALYAVLLAAISVVRKRDEEPFDTIRQTLGRGILLGLEFLIAADIIHTVAVELTYDTVAVLAIIVLIRTFLSFTLEVELTGRWPWQARR